MVMEATKRTYKKHKTEKKITISYELNTKLKPEYFSEDDSINQTNPKYPIYIKVGFRGKSTYLKSRITVYCSIDKLNTFLDSHSDLVRNETNIIERLILESDAYYVENFTFKKVSKLYENLSKSAYEYLSNLFMKELFDIIKSENGRDFHHGTNRFFFFLHGKPNAIVYMSSLLQDLGVSLGKDYLNERSELIKYISDYAGEYHRFHSDNRYDFCLGDILSGFFQTKFVEYYGSMNDSSIKILNDIKMKFS
jgi:hypothetical protein